jgi:hypothetical protein
VVVVELAVQAAMQHPVQVVQVELALNRELQALPHFLEAVVAVERERLLEVLVRQAAAAEQVLNRVLVPQVHRILAVVAVARAKVCLLILHNSVVQVVQELLLFVMSLLRLKRITPRFLILCRRPVPHLQQVY